MTTFLCCKILLLMLLASLNFKFGNTSVLDWMWRAKTDETTVTVADGIPLISIPYESKTDDEKFLQEAAKFTNIQVSSPLETCQHKVIMKIKTSCSDMTEEELAKLSVNLLNCQSAIEGRKLFPCNEEMSLKQCTTDMDADMWNSYHLMSNRARAVCYAARSTHFRALTELTVNKLMNSALSQVEALNTLKQNQDRLEEQTVEALSSLSKGNEALLEQQQYLKDAQITAHNLVTTNLKELNNEKALIRSGHAQFVIMAEDIKKKLEKAHDDLEQQAIERGENHKEVLQDLVVIREQARLIWEKIESSTNHILDQHEQTLAQYEQTLEKLTQINNTIQYIWNITNTMRIELDKKLGWITNYIDDTGEQVQKLYRTFLHIVYILVAMIVAAFLQAPFLTRATIIGLIPVNLITYLKHGLEASLDFTSMTVLIFLITGMHFVMLGIQRIFRPISLNTRVEQSNQSNGYANKYPKEHPNNDVHAYTSSSYANSIKPPLHRQLIQKVYELYNNFSSLISRCIENVTSLIPSNIQSHQQSEELSCSYLPSKKKHEDIIHEYVDDSADVLSDDNTDNDSFNPLISRNEYNENDINGLTNTFDLRRRFNDIDTPTISKSLSRSITPTSASSRKLCTAKTRNGKRCRGHVLFDGDYCHRHSTTVSPRIAKYNFSAR